MSLPQLRLSNPEENRSRTGFSILGSMNDEFAAVLSPGVRHFLGELHRTFDRRRSELLEARAVRQRERDSGRLPDFEDETVDVRESDWQVAPIPPDLTDRRVEITGPVDRKMIINALNSGANVFMADFEDSTAPTWNNVMQGQVNLRDAVLRAIDFTDPRGKEYQLNDETATLFVRPRGWHLDERHLQVDGRPLSGALFDFGVFFYHNAHPLIASGSGPYFYLPKLESYHEARLWNDVFNFSQDYLGIPRGTIRATVLIETIPAAFQMHEILWELRQHSAGLNCGRWDYIFSFIKQFRNLPEFVLPDRGSVTMDRAFLDAYVQLLIQTCHRRGIHAMGGMAAQIPIKDNSVANEKALEKVRQDKLREVRAGHDGTWVAHPGLVAVAREVFDEFMDGPNQIHRTRDDVNVTATDLLSVPEGQITEQGLRHNLDVGIQYLESWLRGNGCVPIYHLMEDAATAEISRSQVWQWVRHRKQLEDGRTISTDLVKQAILEQMEGIRAVKGPLEFARGRYSQAARLFERMITSPQLDDWLTILAYRHI